jgi:anti-sigma B factor antagonist
MVQFPLRAGLDPAAAQAEIEGRETTLSDRELDETAAAREDPVAGVQQEDGRVVVSLAGELDLYNAHVVRDALLRACSEAPERLVVDLTDVRFIDSTALGVLIEARTKLPNRRAFLLAAPGLETRRALQISGLDRHFAVHETLEDALAASL